MKQAPVTLCILLRVLKKQALRKVARQQVYGLWYVPRMQRDQAEVPSQ